MRENALFILIQLVQKELTKNINPPLKNIVFCMQNHLASRSNEHAD